jgi:O-antigen/teichoic acid export membrane protein
MSRSRLLKGGAWLTAGNALSAGASFLRNIAIARLVSVEDFGVVVLLSMTLSIIETVSNLAIDRLLIQAPDGDDPQLQAAAHALQVVRGVIGGLIVYLAAIWVAALFKISHATWAFQVLALVLVIRSFVHLDTVRFQREMHYQPTFWVDAFPQAVSLVIAVPLAYWLRDYSAIVWAMLGQAVVQIAITHRLATRPYRWAWARQTMRRILSFGWPLLANGLLMFAIFQGDKAVIAVAFTPEVVGWYGAAFMLSMAPATLITSVIQSLLLPILARCQDKPEEFGLRYRLVVQTCLVVGLLTGAAFALVGPELLIFLFGIPYSDGVDAIILLGLTQGIRTAKMGQFISAVALAKTKIPMIANISRGVGLLAAIGLVAMGYGPSTVAMTGLVGEAVSYAIGVRLLIIPTGVSLTQQLPQIMVWPLLAVLSWGGGAILRGIPASTFVQLTLSFVWLIVIGFALISISPVLRTELTKLFKGNVQGERK